MYFFITLTTAIALSLDAFSLAIIYGTVLKEKRTILILSLAVGIFHFFMPFLGYLMSNLVIARFISNTNFIAFVIFLILGLEMLFSKNEEDTLMNFSKLTSILLFAFTVSIDSFSVGIAIASSGKIFMPMCMFSTVSFLFTYVGLIIGKKINGLFGKYTTKIGGLMLIFLSFYYLLT